MKIKQEKNLLCQLTKPRLGIRQLALPVYLGRSSVERHTLQEVHFSMDMEFPEAPKAEKTDSLEDTFCYESVCETLRLFVQNRQFHLIEKLAKESFLILKEKYPLIRFRLTLHKTSPPIEGLKGGVTYTCGDIFSKEI